MKVSISSYSFHGLLKQGRMDVFGFLESCKYRYGVDAVEIWNGTLGGRMDREHLRAIRRALDERGLTLANLCVDGAHLWEDLPEAREKNYRSALAYLEAGEVLGARSVRIDMGGAGTELTGEQLDYIVMRYKEFTAACLEEKLRVLFGAGYQGFFGVEHHTGRNEYREVEWQLAELRRGLSRLELEAEQAQGPAPQDRRDQ